MPQIPTIQKEFIPEGAKYSTGPIKEAGATIQHGVNVLANTIRGVETGLVEKYKEYEQARDALEAVRLENNFRDKTDEIALSFSQREDIDNFDKDIAKETDKFETLRPKSTNPNLNLAFERMKGHYTNNLNDVIQKRKYTVMGQQGQVETIKLTDRYIEDYKNAITDKERKEIVDNYGEEVGVLRDNKLINPVFAEQHISGFEKVAQKMAADSDEVTRNEGIRLQPRQTYINLHDPKYLPNLTPKAREAGKHMAEAAIKILNHEEDMAVKEMQKVMHDKEDRAISDLYMNRNYKDAYVAATSSKFITGDEARAWTDRIDAKTKEKSEKKDPAQEAAAFSYFTRLINRPGIDRDLVRKGIQVSPDLSIGTQKELIRDLEREESSEIKTSKDWAFKYGEGLIVPRRGQTAQFLATPEEITKNMLFQKAINEWVTIRANQGKPMTPQEIREKAMEIAPFYQMSMDERQQKIMEETRAYTESMIKSIKKDSPISEQPSKVTDIGLARGKEEPEKKYQATATNPQTGEKMGFINGKWELISKPKK